MLASLVYMAVVASLVYMAVVVAKMHNFIIRKRIERQYETAMTGKW